MSGAYLGGGSSGGGGYIPGSQGSQGSPGGSKRPIAASLRPVTIRQILNATQEHSDSEYQIDGSDPTQLTFVAQIVSMTAGATAVTSRVTDGTGAIEVRQWMESQEDGSETAESFPDMCWVRILGSIKSFHEKRHITAARMFRITDYNEVYFHFLEALQIHLYFTKGSIGENGTAAFGGAPSAYTAGGTANVDSSEFSDLKPIQRQILLWIKSHTVTADGVPITEIAAGFRDTKMSATDLNEAIDYLQDNGHIYITIDEDHYAAA